jgi:hypothetical protein
LAIAWAVIWSRRLIRACLQFPLWALAFRPCSVQRVLGNTPAANGGNGPEERRKCPPGSCAQRQSLVLLPVLARGWLLGRKHMLFRRTDGNVLALCGCHPRRAMTGKAGFILMRWMVPPGVPGDSKRVMGSGSSEAYFENLGRKRKGFYPRRPTTGRTERIASICNELGACRRN